MRYLSAKLILTALTVASTMFASSAFAVDPADRQKLLDTGSCVGCDLRKAYLRGADLNGANLWAANLTGAILEDANLKGADLTNAILKSADMQDVILCNTTMPDGSVIYSGC